MVTHDKRRGYAAILVPMATLIIFTFVAGFKLGTGLGKIKGADQVYQEAIQAGFAERVVSQQTGEVSVSWKTEDCQK